MAGIQIKITSAQLLYEKKRLRSTLRQAGNEVAATARSLIRKSAGGGRMYRGPGGSAKYRGGYAKGAYQASAAGQAPVSVTGTLAKSIRARPFRSGDGVAIRDSAFYALFLEHGAKGGGRRSANGIRVRGKQGVGTTRVLEPRTFLTTALEARRGSLGPRIQASLAQDMKLARAK